MIEEMTKHKIFWELVKLCIYYHGKPVILDGWEVLKSGVIVDYHFEGEKPGGFFRTDWPDFPKNVDAELVQSCGNHIVEM